MPFLKEDLSNQRIASYYTDQGQGQPVILIHGWPLSHRSWEKQVPAIVKAGFRCITYDRRGFGNSPAPWDAYDYSTLAADLHHLIIQLELSDCILVGFSMGGGEVVRYLTDHGTENIAKVALISSIIPLVKQKEDNPNGVPEKDLQQIMGALKKDRIGFLPSFHKNFYNFGENEGRMDEAQLRYDFTIASHASPRATLQAAHSWAETDFRPELKNVTVPTLIVHGNADNIVPIGTSGEQAAKGIPGSQYEVMEQGPHGLNITHAEELNAVLVPFLKA
ncbi:MAG: alpha/beta hydrolase [Sediminicola sp.]